MLVLERDTSIRLDESSLTRAARPFSWNNSPFTTLVDINQCMDFLKTWHIDDCTIASCSSPDPVDLPQAELRLIVRGHALEIKHYKLKQALKLETEVQIACDNLEHEVWRKRLINVRQSRFLDMAAMYYGE